MATVTALVLAVLVSAAWCWILPVLGPRIGYVDEPSSDELKVHRVAAIPLAGPGLLIATFGAVAIVGEIDWPLVAGLTLVTALGVIDDRFGLSPGLRLTAELGVSVLLSLRWMEFGAGYVVVGVVVTVVAINAVNLYDGLDLLAGSTGLAGLVALGLVSSVVGGSPWPALGLAAALVGFLPFNRPPARVFLGDGGAYLLGAVTAVVLLDLGIDGGPAGVVASLGFLGMFAVDLVLTVMRRQRAGRALFEGDRSHLYDRLRERGMDLLAVVGVLVVAHGVIVTLCAMAVVAFSPGWAAVSVAVVGVVGLAVFGPFTMRGPADS